MALINKNMPWMVGDCVSAVVHLVGLGKGVFVCLFVWLVGWLIVWLVGCLVGGLEVWLFGCLFVRVCVLRFGSIFHYDERLFRQRFLGDDDGVTC